MRRIWEAWAVVEWVVKAEAVDIDLLLVTLTKEIQIWEIQICQGLQTWIRIKCSNNHVRADHLQECQEDHVQVDQEDNQVGHLQDNQVVHLQEVCAQEDLLQEECVQVVHRLVVQGRQTTQEICLAIHFKNEHRIVNSFI